MKTPRATPRRSELNRRFFVNKSLKLAVFVSAATFAVCVPAFAGISCTPVATPEPITLTLLATGIGAVAVVRKLRK
jgi:hypothetical protein